MKFSVSYPVLLIVALLAGAFASGVASFDACLAGSCVHLGGF